MEPVLVAGTALKVVDVLSVHPTVPLLSTPSTSSPMSTSQVRPSGLDVLLLLLHMTLRLVGRGCVVATSSSHPASHASAPEPVGHEARDRHLPQTE